MRQRTLLIVNSLVNTLAVLVAAAVRFIIAPFAIGVMGQSLYGLWVVVGQIFAYKGFLDMGLRSAVAREVARHLGRGEPADINRYVNTAAAYYSVVGLLAVVFTGVVAFFFTDWFEVDPQYHRAAQAMVICSGLAVALSIPQNAYGAVVSGLQRYDILSGTQILGDLIRLVLILALLDQVSPGWALVLMALAAGGTQALGAVLRTLSALWLCEHVKWRPWRWERVLAGGMFAFGINSVIYMLSLTVGAQLAQIVIGAFISTAQATNFSLAVLLLTLAKSFVLSFGISARVVASKYDGQNNLKMLQYLLLRSTRYNNVVALSGALVLVMFPGALLRLWMGNNPAYQGIEGTQALDLVATTCRILTIGYGLFWVALPGFNVVNGMGRHRFPARMAIVVGIVSMACAAVLASRDGATIDLVAWGVVLPMVPVWAIIMPWYSCREVGQPIAKYVWQGFVIPAIGCLPAAVVGYLLNRYYAAYDWWSLVWQLGCVGACVAVCSWFFVVVPDDRSYMVSVARRLFGRLGRGSRPGAGWPGGSGGP